jgi:hypothetical protein
VEEAANVSAITTPRLGPASVPATHSAVADLTETLLEPAACAELVVLAVAEAAAEEAVSAAAVGVAEDNGEQMEKNQCKQNQTP